MLLFLFLLFYYLFSAALFSAFTLFKLRRPSQMSGEMLTTKLAFLTHWRICCVLTLKIIEKTTTAFDKLLKSLRKVVVVFSQRNAYFGLSSITFSSAGAASSMSGDTPYCCIAFAMLALSAACRCSSSLYLQRVG